MQKQSWFSEYKWLLLLPLSVIVYFSFKPLMVLLGRKLLGPQSTAFLDEINSAKTSPRILQRIGKVKSSGYKMQSLGEKHDTLMFQLQVKGSQATARIRVYAQIQPNGAWNIYRRDTAFLPPAPAPAPAR